MQHLTQTRRFTSLLCAAAVATLGAAWLSCSAHAQDAAADTPDVAVLQKALAPLIAAPTLGTESDLEITAAKAGISLNVREHLKITAKKPGKFRAEVSLLPSVEGGGAVPTGENYLVVSNGVKVLTVQPSAHQYSLVSVAAFEAANDDMPTLGLFVGPLYLGDQSFADMIAAFSKATTPVLLEALKKQGLGLTSNAQTVDNVDYTVFTLSVAHFGAYRFFVDAKTGTLSRMALSGVQGGLTITMMEKITNRVASPVVTPATFQLTPPAGAHKVKYIPIGSF